MFNLIEKDMKNIKSSLLDKCMKEAEYIAKKAGKYSAKFFGKPKTINKKGRTDLVTEVDIKCESIIKQYLLRKFPDFGFVGEESGKEGDKEHLFSWVVDPIDGTSNFAHGYPLYCVSIGLTYKDTPVMGVIYAPLSKDVYKAHIKSSAYKNDEVIRVSKIKKLIDSMLITGFYYNIATDDNFLKARMLEFENASRNVQTLRRDGSAALDICFIAEGASDGFFECGLSAWDICAGSIILNQAGGMITGSDLGSYHIYSKKQYIATNGLIHKDLIKIL